MTPEPWTFPGEEWRTVAVAPAYEVSSLGRVRRPVGNARNPGQKILSTRTLVRGYPAVYLYRGSRASMLRVTVHRLVAEAFIGPRPDGHDVNHKNFDRTDNRTENLEYLSRRENVRYTTAANRGGSPRRLTPDRALLLYQLAGLREWTQREVAACFGVSQSIVTFMEKGHVWRSVTGLEARYAD